MPVEVLFPLGVISHSQSRNGAATLLGLETEAEKKAASLTPAAGQRLLMD